MDKALLRLHAWLSPGYPVGAYTYSHGLETLIATGEISDGDDLQTWITDLLSVGSGRNDAILLAHAWRSPDDQAIGDLARALSPSSERALETEAQGAAFASVTAAAWGTGGGPAPYPVAVGRAAARADIPLDTALPVFLQTFAANLISAGVRLIPLGQTEGQRVLACLSDTITAAAEEAASASVDDLGGCAFASDIASMHHETLDVRLFRS